jgi:hypothetical protein
MNYFEEIHQDTQPSTCIYHSLFSMEYTIVQQIVHSIVLFVTRYRCGYNLGGSQNPLKKGVGGISYASRVGKGVRFS